MSSHKNKKLIALFVAVLFLIPLACSGGSGEATEAPVVGAATEPVERSGIADLAVPYEAVVQIWAMYYDEAGELQTGWTGSGTILTPDGLILTNAHVVLPERYFPVDELAIAMATGQDEIPEPRYFAEVLQADAALDLAVIRIVTDLDGVLVDDDLNLPFVPLGNSDELDLGDAITILGFPGIGGDTVTLTRGEVSGFTSEPQYGQRAFIKTSATIAGGNSGGLAVDAEGNLIGVPTQLGYGGDDQYVDCRVIADTNRDGFIDDLDSCVPTGGFINALRPVTLARPLIEAAQRGEVSITGAEEPVAIEMGAESDAFNDDFSDESSGWDVFYEESESSYYENGVFVLEDINDPTIPIANAYRSFSDLEIAVDVQVTHSEGVANEVTVLCRYLDGSNYYGFRVYEDGSYGIYKFLDGEFFSLASGQNDAAILGDGVHTLHVLCEGSTLGLGINDEFLTEAEDSSFASGDVGLSITAWEGNLFTATFDNFSATPSGGGTAPTTSNETLLFDDFSDNSEGWTVDSGADYGYSVENGAYVIEVHEPNYIVWSALTDDYGDVVMNVDVSIEQGAGDGDLGLICRYIDAQNFYAFEVTEDGYYSIWKMTNDVQTTLVEWTYSETLVTTQDFILNASCNGNELLLGFQGELIAEAVDPDHAYGGVGLLVGTLENPDFVVAFDNFEVLSP
jgi:S1-C subfamily serine protease